MIKYSQRWYTLRTQHQFASQHKLVRSSRENRDGKWGPSSYWKTCEKKRNPCTRKCCPPETGSAATRKAKNKESESPKLKTEKATLTPSPPPPLPPPRPLARGPPMSFVRCVMPSVSRFLVHITLVSRAKHVCCRKCSGRLKKTCWRDQGGGGQRCPWFLGR